MSRKSSKIDRICTGLVLVSLTLLCSLVSAQTQSPSPAAANGGSEEETHHKDFKYVMEVGGQYRDINGERPSKFEEYKSVRNGFLIRRGSFEYNPEGAPTFLSFAARNVTERDQQYYIEGGQYGRFRLEGIWDSQPHLYARGVRSLLGSAGAGVYTVPDSMQANLQALDPPMAGTTVPNPALIAATKSYVNSTTGFDLRTQRQTFTVDGRYNVTSNWYIGFRVFDTKRFGQRPLGTGSYERVGTSSGDTFRVHAIELPAQMDQRTTNFAFVSGYLTRDWGVNFEYTYSRFRNSIDSYVYDNPFRLTDQATTGSAGAFNRMAFARGLHSAMPDNEAQGIMITGFVNLPLDSRWAAAFGWQRWTQDQAFLPYTLNTQTTAPFDVTDPANLPEDSLDGEIENITVDQLFTTRPWSNFTFNARYKAYRERNNTQPIHFDGYAAYLEAYWRTGIQGSYSPPGQPKPIENEPASYTRQRAGGEVIWEILSNLRWKGEFEWERWDRTHRQADQTDEQKYITSVMWKPFHKLKTDFDYRYQVRTPDSYIVGPLENQSLRMFDQAKRIRHDVKFQWQWAATPRLGLSGDFAYYSDDYDQNFYGLTRYIERRAGIEVLYNAKENTTVYANYSREHYNSSLQSISKGANPTFDVRNRWNRDDRNTNDNFGIGVTTYLHRTKWYLDANYNVNLGRDLMTTSNPTTPAPAALLNATAYNFPEAEYRYQEFSIDSNYQIFQNVALGIRYLYEPYRMDDWQLNNLSPYPVDALAPETDGRKFLLLDSRYTSHNGHIFTVYLRFGN